MMGVRSPSYVFFTGGTFMNESDARRRELLDRHADFIMRQAEARL